MDVIYLLDLLGTSVFAISGSLVAIDKKLDPFGVFIIGFVTAVGGGTVRDILTGRTPVGWMLDINYTYIIVVSVIIAIIFRNKLGYLSKSLFLFDTIGLGVFTIIGVQIGILSHLYPLISIALGILTASFGGVIRDILCNDIPIIFRKEIYATACMFGAASFLIFHHLGLNQNLNYLITIFEIIAIRIIAVKFHLSLPTFYKKS